MLQKGTDSDALLSTMFCSAITKEPDRQPLKKNSNSHCI